MLWVSGRGRVVARAPDGKAQRVANIVVDITARKKAEEHVQMLMREVSHRSKNLLAVVQAIAGQTARSAQDLENFQTSFGQRLQGLAASQDLLVQENWRGAPLADLARQQLVPFAEPGPRLVIDGPDVMVTAAAAQSIGLALHELATNATKYGAWSLPAGKIALTWAFNDESADEHGLRLSWVESGGPSVSPPTRKGFGQTMVEDLVAQSVNGEVDIDYGPAGLRWSLSLPDSNLVGA
jgi:two-component sensor histidine kinase